MRMGQERSRRVRGGVMVIKVIRGLAFLSPLPLAGEGGEPPKAVSRVRALHDRKKALPRPCFARAPSPASGRGENEHTARSLPSHLEDLGVPRLDLLAHLLDRH